MYLVTKHFVSGALAGLVVTEKTSVRFNVGKTYHVACGGGSRYVVTRCIPCDSTTPAVADVACV